MCVCACAGGGGGGEWEEVEAWGRLCSKGTKGQQLQIACDQSAWSRAPAPTPTACKHPHTRASGAHMGGELASTPAYVPSASRRGSGKQMDTKASALVEGLQVTCDS